MNKGTHLIVDCYDLDKQTCLNDKLVLKLMVEGAEKSGANVINTSRYRFGHNSPPGFTCFVMLDESHCSAHSYAAEGMIAFDFFTCGDCDPTLIFQHIRNNLNMYNYEAKTINRFIVDNSRKVCYTGDCD